MKRAAKSFEELIVWKKAHKLVLEVYKFSAKFPEIEIYTLTSQFRRAIISVPANIAEGFKGSLEESRYYLILASDLGYGDNSQLLQLLEEVSKLLESYSYNILASGS